MKKNRMIPGIMTVCFLFFIFNMPVSILYSQQTISDSSITERLHTIEQMLMQAKPRANTWWYGWLIGYSAATVGQGIVLLTSESRATRQDMAAGGVTTLLGAAGQLITPMDPAKAPGLLAKLPENTKEERLVKLEEAENQLRLSALREKSGRSLQTHAVCFLVNTGSGLVTWFGFHRNALAGFENFALNTVITEVQIFSQPTRAMKDYKAYLSKYSSVQSSYSKRTELRFFVYAVPGGLGMRMIF